ncbi:MAG: hypothetical protein ACRD4A_00430, partial [Candidatus Acidiferrales bacterium]
ATPGPNLDEILSPLRSIARVQIPKFRPASLYKLAEPVFFTSGTAGRQTQPRAGAAIPSTW